MRRARWALGAVLIAAAMASAAPAARATSAKVTVVAAEDFWGSIARQLGGDHADVKSVIDDPETHAHDYEPKPSDGAAFATAKIAIVNGIGYDPWAMELLSANPSSSRKLISVGDLVGVKEGGNPHQWYSPPSVERVIDSITDALKQADPANAAFFDRQRQVYRAEKLKRYNELRAQIKAQFDGTPVGASESIFAPMADDLGLEVLTPRSFQAAIAEGQDPTAADKAIVDKQITGKQIKVFVYNSQNSTPDVGALVDKARKAGIPVTTVTETPSPKGALFQDWQADQLQSLADALAKTGGTPAAATIDATEAPATAAAPAPMTAPPGDAGPSTAGDGAAASSEPASALARTGTAARWSLLLAGLAFVAGGLALGGGAAPRRNRPAARDVA